MLKHESLSQIINLLAELTVFDSYSFGEFLKKLIILVLKIVPLDSCLIYFYDREVNELILIASKKPHAQLMGKIKLKKGEGITGWVAAHEQPVALEKKAYEDERFKYFKELPEDKYEAFFSFPIPDKEGTAGVLNLQHKTEYKMTKEQIKILEAVVKIVATGFEKVVLERKIGHLENKLEERKLIERAKGILMKNQSFTEHEAYEMIRKEAMKKRKTMKDIAEAVLLVY